MTLHAQTPYIIDLAADESYKAKVVKDSKSDKWYMIEEWLQALKMMNLYDTMKMLKIYLVPDLVIPNKFKVLEFIKYTGT